MRHKSTREHACAKRTKGIEAHIRRRMSDAAISNQPRRCQSSGGSSGKSNNAGRAPRFEQGGFFSQPGPRAPHHVKAGSAS